MTLYKTALLLEDDHDDQEIFKAAIQERFPELTYYIFNNGSEGLDFLNAGIMPDIIFSDISMPLVDGKKFLAEYNRKSDFKPISPVIMMSTSKAKRDKEECLHLGASYYLIKPTSFLELLRELEFVLTHLWLPNNFPL